MSTSTKPPRPAVTQAMYLQAAQIIAARNHWEPAQAEDIAEAFSPHDDGYELAKKLDNDFGWDISAMDVEALDQMDPTDREVLALRHFEQLTSPEVARILGIQERAAAKRYLRAIERLRGVLSEMPGGLTELRP